MNCYNTGQKKQLEEPNKSVFKNVQMHTPPYLGLTWLWESKLMHPTRKGQATNEQGVLQTKVHSYTELCKWANYAVGIARTESNSRSCRLIYTAPVDFRHIAKISVAPPKCCRRSHSSQQPLYITSSVCSNVELIEFWSHTDSKYCSS